ncbi:hypothetical protein SR1949_14090 [Sphaerospermopsis reniformis]|uniref:Methyltransferase small domain-containing protein n=1 Tax=Sphaerospermopsis reniformis TaxID=531300 RepID=A0A479ZXJ3_9CYAN|nr:methyltransferase [Sphaerospermopsis reniformis]GCL36306.1 hypothetical protein SR1949_14090 [Sphaerospermopsis reniformis]
MKQLIRMALTSLVKNELFWFFFAKTIAPLTYYAENSRFKAIFGKRIVMNGPFKGMKYPQTKAICSAIYPKLLGSYEYELEPLMRELCKNCYSEIVDIGCAKGYYAVGLAIQIETAKVFAFDTNPEALTLCKTMAELNNVASRVITGAYCDAETLMALPLTGKALVISDCEGYEKELFTNKVADHLRRHEILIEIHDFVDNSISEHIKKLFSSTHEITIYSSINDEDKIINYNFKSLLGFQVDTKRLILREGRPMVMKWFYMKPKEF